MGDQTQLSTEEALRDELAREVAGLPECLHSQYSETLVDYLANTFKPGDDTQVPRVDGWDKAAAAGKWEVLERMMAEGPASRQAQEEVATMDAAAARLQEEIAIIERTTVASVEDLGYISSAGCSGRDGGGALQLVQCRLCRRILLACRFAHHLTRCSGAAIDAELKRSPTATTSSFPASSARTGTSQGGHGRPKKKQKRMLGKSKLSKGAGHGPGAPPLLQQSGPTHPPQDTALPAGPSTSAAQPAAMGAWDCGAPAGCRPANGAPRLEGQPEPPFRFAPSLKGQRSARQKRGVITNPFAEGPAAQHSCDAGVDVPVVAVGPQANGFAAVQQQPAQACGQPLPATLPTMTYAIGYPVHTQPLQQAPAPRAQQTLHPALRRYNAQPQMAHAQQQMVSAPVASVNQQQQQQQQQQQHVYQQQQLYQHHQQQMLRQQQLMQAQAQFQQHMSLQQQQQQQQAMHSMLPPPQQQMHLQALRQAHMQQVRQLSQQSGGLPPGPFPGPSATPGPQAKAKLVSLQQLHTTLPSIAGEAAVPAAPALRSALM